MTRRTLDAQLNAQFILRAIGLDMHKHGENVPAILAELNFVEALGQKSH